ncbi:MAG TPA: hypothetical protein VI306_26160 [Pyrinomonadaceae bacterium]
MFTLRRSLSLLLLVAMASACSTYTVVSYDVVKSYRVAQGSTTFGYSTSALEEATRLSEVRRDCGTPLQEWEATIPFFGPPVKHLKYRTADPNGNVINADFIFAETSADPSLIAIQYVPSN